MLMHELSVVQGIMDVIEKERKDHNFTKVNVVNVVCGRYHCLSEGTLQFCFDAAAGQSYMRGATLRLARSDSPGIFVQTMEVE